MYHIARNVLTDTALQHKRSAQTDEIGTLADQIGGGPLADEALQREQEVALLHEALARLSPDHREVLVLSRYQELKYEEIARILNTTEGAVKVRVHRAITELKTIYLRVEHDR